MKIEETERLAQEILNRIKKQIKLTKEHNERARVLNNE